MENHFKPTIVIDLGSGETKAGLAENEFPSCTIPTAVSCSDTDSKGFHIGHQALDKDSITYPIQHGIIQNYEHIERLLDHIFTKELDIRSEEHPILVTQPPKNPQRDKEKLAEILFEKFNSPALYEEVHSVLTFYSSGRPAGLMVESGHGLTSVVPILSGYAISEAILRLDIGGGDLDEYLTKILNEKSNDIIKPEETRILKEKLCYIPDKTNNETEVESYTLPDGRSITLAEERHQATEPLFQPSLVEQYDVPGIHEMIFQSIFKSGFDLRKEFASNIVLSGGTTLFKGIEDRLRQELEERVPPSMKVNIIADPDRKVFVWRGGSILGSLSTFHKNICVSKQDYEEFGVPIIRKKCMSGL